MTESKLVLPVMLELVEYLQSWFHSTGNENSWQGPLLMCAVCSWFLKEQMLPFSIKIQLVVNWRRKTIPTRCSPAGPCPCCGPGRPCWRAPARGDLPWSQGCGRVPIVRWMSLLNGLDHALTWVLTLVICFLHGVCLLYQVKDYHTSSIKWLWQECHFVCTMMHQLQQTSWNITAF